jgi:hypothetical protein
MPGDATEKDVDVSRMRKPLSPGLKRPRSKVTHGASTHLYPPHIQHLRPNLITLLQTPVINRLMFNRCP